MNCNSKYLEALKALGSACVATEDGRLFNVHPTNSGFAIIQDGTVVERIDFFLHDDVCHSIRNELYRRTNVAKGTANDLTRDITTLVDAVKQVRAYH